MSNIFTTIYKLLQLTTLEKIIIYVCNTSSAYKWEKKKERENMIPTDNVLKPINM